jgi:2-desacetyl-2-hydroxyethyl bacteriochlorophyllide A dehydrogenase
MKSESAGFGERVKLLLERGATEVFFRLGYSGQMAQDAKREGWWWLSARAEAMTGSRRLLRGLGIVWTHPGRCELLPIETPYPNAHEVAVEILASVVSTGTERAQAVGLPGAQVRYPHRPGYSAAGVVAVAGRSAEGLVEGDVVALSSPHASLATVPARSVYRVPRGVSVEDAAFVQLGIIARQGIRRAGIEHGDSVCVVGAGVIGVLAQRLARAAGCGDLTTIAETRRHERVALAGGKGRFLALADGESPEDVRARIVIEATGSPAALHTAVAAAAPGGRVVLLGSPRGRTLDFPYAALQRKRLALVGAHISTLSRKSGSPAEAFSDEAAAFLEQLQRSELEVADLVDLTLDPRESGVFYRRLPTDRELCAARFDWTLVSRAKRIRRGRLLSAPDLSGRGVDVVEKPVAWRRHSRSPHGDDPFAGAAGSLRFGIIGCGDIGVSNAAAIAAAPNTQLVACHDPISRLADEVSRRHGATAVPSLEAMLERPDVDAIFLAVPHDLHAPLAIQAALAGRHVVVEKPPSTTLPHAVEMARAAADAGVAISVCFPSRYQPDATVAKQMIGEGGLGELEGTLTTFLADRPPSYWYGGFSGRSPSDWRASRERAGGGVLIMNLSHYVDLLRDLVRVEAETITAFAGATAGAEVEDSISVSIRFANGATGSLYGSSAVRGTWQGRRSSEMRIWGSDGHVALGESSAFYTLRALDGARPGRWSSLPRRGAPSRAIFVSRFATAVHEERAPDVTVDDWLAVQAFMEAVYRSVELGAPVAPAALLADASARRPQEAVEA